MKDVSFKSTTLRTATASATLKASMSSILAIRQGNVPKGDPLPIAKVAAIQAAKKTAEWIPYCHNIPIEFVNVEFQLRDEEIEITVLVRTIARTGVEVEAMTAASAAALTLYDMLKMIDDHIEISGVSLLQKSGGKSGQKRLAGWKGLIVVASDRVSAGEFSDLSGDLLKTGLESHGALPCEKAVVTDEIEAIQAAMRNGISNGANLVIVTGGTGISSRDVTPESILPLIDRRLPGVEEALRSYGQVRMGAAMLSRSVAGVAGNTIVIGVPGSPQACTDALNALFPEILHAIEVLKW